MRLNINLASQPYEAAQAYRRQITTVIAALAMVAALLVGYIVYQRQHTSGINREIAQVQSQIRSLGQEETQARALLNKPVNRAIADQSDFLNQLFARKSLSWTRIFTEMEKIVPAGLHVVSMKPEYTKTNDLVLHVIVATDSRDRAVEMVRHMEKSTHLRQAQIVAETVTTNSSGDQAAGGGNIQFDIAAVYVPGAENDEAADTEAGAETKSAAAQPPASGAHKPPAPGTAGNVNAAQNRPAAAGRGSER
jgi:type IV pilus assembly protein PilN